MNFPRLAFLLTMAAFMSCIPIALCADSDDVRRDKESSDQRLVLSSLKVYDLEGHPMSFLTADDAKGVGLVFLTTECPIARRYLPEIGRLANQFAEQGVPICGVISDRSVSRAAAKSWKDEFQIEFPLVFDASGELAASLKPTHTPEAFLFNKEGEQLYRGRIDNLFGRVGRNRQRATQREFFDALKAVADGRRPDVRYAEPIGCPVEELRTPATKGDVTYCRDIAPILYNNCAACHHKGAVAPFSLTTFDDASKRAGWLAEVTAKGLMPPWNAKIGFGHFKGERVLSKNEVSTLAAWAKAGAPYGNPNDLPRLPEFTNDWTLGEPDLIVRMPKPMTIPADGPDVFRFIPVRLDLPKNRHVAAIEFRPGNPRVVHHAIVMTAPEVFLRDFAPAAEMPGFDPVTDGLPRVLKLIQSAQSQDTNLNFGVLGAWVPGMQTYSFPKGSGVPLGKDSTLLLQMHYYPSGKEETDQSEVGIYFCDEPVKGIATGFALNVMNLNIPPGKANHRVETSLTLPVDAEVFGITPHMHLLGREMKVTATKPDGEVEQFIWVDDWNWNWQGQYRYQKPIHLPRGTRLDLVAVYDNSRDNPANPNTPPQKVRFGRKTTDEMCLCFLQVVVKNPGEQQQLRQAALRNVAKQFGTRFELFLNRNR